MGYYLQEQFKYDNWVFLLGGRYDTSRTDFDNRTTGASHNVRDEDFTWSGGVAYVFDNGLTPYISYSEFFLPVTDLNAVTNEPFKPEEGNQKEIGIKYQPEGLDAMFTAAAFELTQENVTKNRRPAACRPSWAKCAAAVSSWKPRPMSPRASA